METQAQNGTDTQLQTDTTVPPVPPPQDPALLKVQLEEWITFTAIGGLVTEADGNLDPMTVSKFAELIKVPRRTLYNWRRDVPDFWQRVEIRRREMMSKDRITKVWNGVYLRAAKGDAAQATMILSHFSDYKPPAQAHEIELKGMGDVIANTRKKMQAAGMLIEGEVTNATGTSQPQP